MRSINVDRNLGVSPLTHKSAHSSESPESSKIFNPFTPMKDSTLSKSFCQYCRHYTAEGRRGGTCEQLGVPVQGQWTACGLMLPSLRTEPERIEITALDSKEIYAALKQRSVSGVEMNSETAEKALKAE